MGVVGEGGVTYSNEPGTALNGELLMVIWRQEKSWFLVHMKVNI